MAAELSDTEAILLSRKVQRESSARRLLSTRPRRFPRVLVWLLPSLVVLPFGQWLSQVLSIKVEVVWMLLFLFAFVWVATQEIVLLNRKVAALTHLLASDMANDA